MKIALKTSFWKKSPEEIKESFANKTWLALMGFLILIINVLVLGNIKEITGIVSTIFIVPLLIMYFSYLRYQKEKGDIH